MTFRARGYTYIREVDIAYELGIQRLETESTLVKDRVLQRNHEQFEKAILEEIFFTDKFCFADQNDWMNVQTKNLGKLPKGSEVLQKVIEDLIRIRQSELHTEAEAEIERQETEMSDVSSVNESSDCDNLSACDSVSNPDVTSPISGILDEMINSIPE